MTSPIAPILDRSLPAIPPSLAPAIGWANAPGIARIASGVAPGIAQPGSPHSAMHQAAVQFESLLVRQMLSTCSSSGLGASGGYGGMAVDALADGLTGAGGLGLAQQIERALDRAVLGENARAPSARVTVQALADPAVHSR